MESSRCWRRHNTDGPDRIGKECGAMLQQVKDFQSVRRLCNGVEMPVIGYGTRAVGAEGIDGECSLVRSAVECGYRHIDTASRYGNEAGVGRGVKNCAAERRELFITTKLSIDCHGYDRAVKAFEESLERLGMDYVDLYLVHWPVPRAGYFTWKETLSDTWKAMEDIYASGRARAIGVSNCTKMHLAFLCDHAAVRPMVNQIEFHPGFAQFDTLRFCLEQGIVTQAWSPLGQGGLLKSPLLEEMALRYQVSPARLCIRWALQHGVVPVVKSSNKERMLENADVFDFQIGAEDMNCLDELPLYLIGPHPEHGYIHG